MDKRPAVVDAASWLLWAMVAAGGVVTVLVMVFSSELDRVWSPDPDTDSQVEPVDFVAVIVVLYVVVALTTLFLIPLLRHGHNWARHSLAVLAAGILLSAVAVVQTSPPQLIRFCTIAAAVLAAVTLVFLWHVEARRFCSEAERVRSEEIEDQLSADADDAGSTV
jgi:hypothetical protein